MHRFNLDTARAIASWLLVILPQHESDVARAEVGLGPAAVLDLAILRALGTLRAEPTRELFVYVRWCVQHHRADEAHEERALLAALERRRVFIDADGATWSDGVADESAGRDGGAPRGDDVRRIRPGPR